MDAFVFIALGALGVTAVIWAWTRYADFLAQSPNDYAASGEIFDIRRHSPNWMQSKKKCKSRRS